MFNIGTRYSLISIQLRDMELADITEGHTTYVLDINPCPNVSIARYPDPVVGLSAKCLQMGRRKGLYVNSGLMSPEF